MRQIRTLRYRLQLSAQQAEMMASFAGVVRFVYNLALEQRRDWWRQYKANTGAAISLASQSREMVALRASADWIEAVPRCALEQALRDLDTAYHRFFAGKSGYPSPRKKGVNDSFRIPGAAIYRPVRHMENLRYAEIKLPKMGWCRFRLTRDLPAEFKLLTATIALDAIGWHLCIAVEMPAVDRDALPGMVGIDRGIANTLSFSDGSFASQPASALRRLHSRGNALRKQIARQVKGSARRKAAIRLLIQANAKAARMRKHWNHEQSSRIAASFGTVVIEALKTSVMTRSAKGTTENPGVGVRQKAGLNRAILENGWSQFEQMLTYKLEASGGKLIRVEPAFTSLTCSMCGSISKKHRKSQAVFECRDCGHAAHADTNAAINILRAGEQPASRGPTISSVKREPSAETIQ